jgi:hypothetical protein
MDRCVVCKVEFKVGTVHWYDYELGAMHMECRE